MNQINQFCVGLQTNWADKAERKAYTRVIKELKDDYRKNLILALKDPALLTDDAIANLSVEINRIESFAMNKRTFKIETKRETGFIKSICRIASNFFQNRTSSSEVIETILASKVSSVKMSDSEVKMSDSEIISNLEKQGFNQPVNTLSDGRCLFGSIACHIDEQDLTKIEDNIQMDEWCQLPIGDKANLLRKWAINTEKKLFTELFMNSENPSDEAVSAINELYADIRQELHASNLAQLRNLLKTASYEEKLDYCRSNFDQYISNTSREKNWAGTTELRALGKLFNRQVIMFGQNHASSLEVSNDEKGNVLPYYTLQEGKTPPIFVFQQNGGGHYRQLTRIKT